MMYDIYICFLLDLFRYKFIKVILNDSGVYVLLYRVYMNLMNPSSPIRQIMTDKSFAENGQGQADGINFSLWIWSGNLVQVIYNIPWL